MADMTYQFQLPDSNFQRNKFVKNYQWKSTIDSGYLIPMFWDEVLPGDTKDLNSTVFGRMSTPFVPVMDNVYCDIYYFFVPNRLLWSHWKNFMGEQYDDYGTKPGTDYLVPEIQAPQGGFENCSIFDYFGFPTKVGGLKANSFTFYLRAYNLIWNQWFRANQLQDPVEVPFGDGPDDYRKYTLLKKNKRFDYFTSCLPTPQNGPATGVTLPLGDKATVVYGQQNTGSAFRNDSYTGKPFGIQSNSQGLAITAEFKNPFTPTNDNIQRGLYADLSTASASTVNSLRQAIATQHYLEREMRCGTRYIEKLFHFFGVENGDRSLQRSELLGMSTIPLNVSPIAQTSSSDNVSPQGNLSAMATFGAGQNGFVKSFTEHGVVLGLMCIRTDNNYQQGLDRHFTRKTPYDYFWSDFAHIGEQSVLNKEIYAQGTAVDEDVFGYIGRFDEYRFKNNIITGKLRSNDPQSLDIWHFAQKYTSLPTLSSDFVAENPQIKRALAVQTEPEFIMDVYHDYSDIKVVPMYGTPGLERI